MSAGRHSVNQTNLGQSNAFTLITGLTITALTDNQSPIPDRASGIAGLQRPNHGSSK